MARRVGKENEMTRMFRSLATSRMAVAVVMAMAMLCVALAAPSVALADVVASGTVGTLPWRVESGAQEIQGVESTLTLVLGAQEGNHSMPGGLTCTNGPWSSYASQLTGVRFEGTVVALQSMDRMFAGMSGLKVVEMDGSLDTSDTTSMYETFAGCPSLEVVGVGPGVDLSGLDLSSVVTMASMFEGCTSITEVTLDDIEAPVLTTMEAMFRSCTALDAVYASGMDLPELEVTDWMFDGCTSLSMVSMQRVSAPSWESVRAMFRHAGDDAPADEGAFADLSWSDLPSDMNEMFATSGFTGVSMMLADGSRVESAKNCFYGSSCLLDVSLDGCLMPSCTDVSFMFDSCTRLEALNVRAADLSGVTNVMNFAPVMGSYEGEGLVASFQGTRLPKDMGSMFAGCVGLVSCDLRGDLSEVTSMRFAFSGCTSLGEVWVGTGVPAPKLASIIGMFGGCSSLEAIHMDGVVTSVLTEATAFAQNCSKLAVVEARNWDLSGATSVSGFVVYAGEQASSQDTTYGGLEVYLSGSKMPVNAGGMFTSSFVQRVDFEDVDFSGTRSLEGFFAASQGVREVDLTGIKNHDLSSLTNMSHVATQCPALEWVDLSGLDASSVTDLSRAFAQDSALRRVDMGGMDVPAGVTNANMFADCSRMSHVVMPEGLTFATTNLPDVPVDDVNDGTWLYLPDASNYTSAELMAETPGAGTYVWDGTDVFRIRYLPGEGRGEAFEQAWLVSDGTWFVAEAGDRFRLFDHEIAGWNTSEDGSGQAYEPGMLVEGVPSTNPYVLHAQWVPLSHETMLEDGGFDVTVPAGYRLVVDGLPAGTGYVVWEESAGGWTLVSSTGTTGQVAPLQTQVAHFTNRYTPGTAAMQVVGTKTLDGELSGDGSFEFELLEGGEVIQVAHNGAGGVVAFEPIVYDAVGTHEYVVREKAGLVTTLTYDKAEYRVVVDVIDDGEGHLSTSVSYPGGVPSWANRTNPGGIRLTKQVTGASDANANDEFSFTIRLTDPDGNLVENATIVRDGRES